MARGPAPTHYLPCRVQFRRNRRRTADNSTALPGFGKRHGVRTLLNPAPALPNLDPEQVKLATFLVPNETELAILTGMPVETLDHIAEAARALIAKGIETVVMTMARAARCW